MHTYSKGNFWPIRLVTVVFCFGLLFLHAPSASADPHAMFYTTTGQQQLFFNVLAALNQSDFVEPAEQSPATPPGNSRQELLEKRQEEGFGSETDPRITQTQTDLASVLTRSITLEGNDLWTAYLLHQFAIERTRVRNTDELVRIYCERGLGLPECESSTEDAQKLIKEKEKAFEVDTLKMRGNVVTRGLALLISGLPGHQEQAKDTIQQDPNDDEPELPLTYDENIDDWWSKAKENDSNQQKQASAVSQILNIMGGYFHEQVDPRIWDYVTFNSDGNPSFSIPDYADSESGPPLKELNIHEAALDTLLTNQIALKETADAGIGRVAAQTIDTHVDGAKPDIELDLTLAETDEGANEEKYGEIYSKVTLPAYAKSEQTKAAIHTLPNTEQNRKYAATESEHTPGEIQSVDRGGSEGNVAGIQSNQSINTSGEQGRVLHSVSTNEAETDDPTHHVSQQSGSPNDNDTAFHHETAPSHFIEALGYKPPNGCGCSLHTATNHYGQSVIERINRL